MIPMCVNSWDEFKNLVASKNLFIQYSENNTHYDIHAEEGGIYDWKIGLFKDSGLDVTDFENNYKPIANQPIEIKGKDGRLIVRSDSRPRTATTIFTSRGDSANNIGDGSEMFWDFSNSDDLITDSITTPIPSGHKRKRIKLQFADPVWVKEGTVYGMGAPKGCFLDFWVICPDTGYYLDRNEVPQQANGDVPITHYVIKHRMYSDCPMGDELNTEGAMEDALPSSYQLWLEITTPDSDNSSYGHCTLEIYRYRTCLLPGEDI